MTKVCAKCQKRLAVPDLTVQKSGGVTTYDVGIFGHRAGLLADSVSANHGRLTPKVWECAAESDLDAIRRRHDPTPEQSFEDAEKQRRDLVLAYVMSPDQADLASVLSVN